MIGFWIFMLIMDLLIPFAMIGFGRMFMNKPPKSINAVFGYRTTMSMKNGNTWKFAHNHCGKTWFWTGLVMLPISVLPLLLVLGKDADTVGTVGAITCCVQIVPMLVSIIPTERALRKAFDQNGKRKEI